jgi:hypothetical protein
MATLFREPGHKPVFAQMAIRKDKDGSLKRKAGENSPAMTV